MVLQSHMIRNTWHSGQWVHPPSPVKPEKHLQLLLVVQQKKLWKTIFRQENDFQMTEFLSGSPGYEDWP